MKVSFKNEGEIKIFSTKAQKKFVTSRTALQEMIKLKGNDNRWKPGQELVLMKVCCFPFLYRGGKEMKTTGPNGLLDTEFSICCKPLLLKLEVSPLHWLSNGLQTAF